MKNILCCRRTTGARHLRQTHRFCHKTGIVFILLLSWISCRGNNCMQIMRHDECVYTKRFWKFIFWILCSGIQYNIHIFWYSFWKIKSNTNFPITSIYDMINMSETKQKEGKQILFIISGHKWYLYLILVLIASYYCTLIGLDI